MSIKLEIDSLPYETRKQIVTTLRFLPNSNRFSSFSRPEYIFAYHIEDEYIYVPFSYGVMELKAPRQSRKSYDTINVEFKGVLRDNQKIVKNEAVSLLNKNGSVIISCYPGFGKSSMGIFLASKIGLRTLIITKGLVLLEQWKKAIEQFCPMASINILTVKNFKKIHSLPDFCIINAQNVEKIPREFFGHFGTVICDEIHVLVAPVLCKSLFYVSPRYLIGLSATPYRSDGLEILLDLFFGKEKIHRKLYREHFLYKVNTGLVPDVEYGVNGLNWESVLMAQASNKDRNELIIKMTQHFKERGFLILCKRKDQAKYFIARFEELKENFDYLMEDKSSIKTGSRILIAILQKCGLGWDCPENINTLVVASDLEEYYYQYLGRVLMRSKETPWIFDLVDEMHTLLQHYYTRRAVCKEAGATICDFYKSFPIFILPAGKK